MEELTIVEYIEQQPRAHKSNYELIMFFGQGMGMSQYIREK